jgi:hypothetical protein
MHNPIDRPAFSRAATPSSSLTVKFALIVKSDLFAG